MKLPPKEVTCDCGNTSVVEKQKSWCAKCGRPVFYDKKDKTRHKLNTLYYVAIMLAVITFITYVFLELIVTPFLGG
jgi:hypothetical protein